MHTVNGSARPSQRLVVAAAAGALLFTPVLAGAASAATTSGDSSTEASPGPGCTYIVPGTNECFGVLGPNQSEVPSESEAGPQVRGLVNRCQRSEANRAACGRILDSLWSIFMRKGVDIQLLTPVFEGCRAGNSSSCKELQARAGSLGVG